MDFDAFLARVVDDGIVAARADYAQDPDKRTGAVAGFEACRGLDGEALKALYAAAQNTQVEAFRIQHARYWLFRCFAAEVEWVCNVVSAALANVGQPPLYPSFPTARGVMKAAAILGVAEARA